MQLHAGDKRMQWWGLGSDWLTQLLRWCEDCRLRLSNDRSARGCHLATSLPQMPVGLASLTAEILCLRLFLLFCRIQPLTFKSQSQTGYFWNTSPYSEHNHKRIRYKACIIIEVNCPRVFHPAPSVFTTDSEWQPAGNLDFIWIFVVGFRGAGV